MINNEIVLLKLEELANRIGISVRYENINIDEVCSTGGLCLFEDKYILILDSKTTVQEKIQATIEALQQFDPNDVYVKPLIRELLEGSGE